MPCAMFQDCIKSNAVLYHAFICQVLLAAGREKDANSLSGREGSGPRQSNSPGKFAGLVQESIVLNGPNTKVAKKSLGTPKRRVPVPLKSGLYDFLPSPEKSIQ